jgi:hypothetical protein
MWTLPYVSLVLLLPTGFLLTTTQLINNSLIITHFRGGLCRERFRQQPSDEH